MIGLPADHRELQLRIERAECVFIYKAKPLKHLAFLAGFRANNQDSRPQERLALKAFLMNVKLSKTSFQQTSDLKLETHATVLNFNLIIVAVFLC